MLIFFAGVVASVNITGEPVEVLVQTCRTLLFCQNN